MPEADLAAQVQELMDRQRIRDVIMTYARALDRLDPELINSVFHDDAEVAYQGFTAVGKEIGPALVNNRTKESARKMAMHSISNHLCQIDGDVANCETYFVMWGLTEASDPERLLENAGRYLDRLERRNGEWKIVDRVVIWDWQRVTINAEPFSVAPGRPRGQQSREDPSYRFLPPLGGQ